MTEPTTRKRRGCQAPEYLLDKTLYPKLQRRVFGKGKYLDLWEKTGISHDWVIQKPLS